MSKKDKVKIAISVTCLLVALLLAVYAGHRDMGLLGAILYPIVVLVLVTLANLLKWLVYTDRI